LTILLSWRPDNTARRFLISLTFKIVLLLSFVVAHSSNTFYAKFAFFTF